jgi:quercetin dioxygenase-like cupin family protein
MASPFTPAVALRGEHTGGAISVMDNAVPARWGGPPLHHHEFDETFYVLDGELTFQVGDELYTAGPGALAFAPGGVVHTFANLGGAPARYLLLCTPAGFEGYFARLAAEAAGEDPPAWALAPTPPVTTVGGQIGERDDVAAATPIAPAGGPLSVLVGSEQSDGRIAVMENRLAAGTAGPRLRYDDLDQLFWVLDGELAFQLGEERVVRRAGEMVFARRGVHHSFANEGDDEARTLIVCTPAGAAGGGS